MDRQRQNDCDVPLCIGSRDDLWSCGGIALSVREWATIQAIELIPVNSGPRGPVCGRQIVRMWASILDTREWIVPSFRNTRKTVMEMIEAAKTIEECDVFVNGSSMQMFERVLQACQLN